MRRRHVGHAIAVALSMHAASLEAQLRPLDPARWSVFDGDTNFSVSIGAAVLGNQRVPLAGTRGRLDEIGIYSVSWRSSRIAITASGTALWHMAHEKRIEDAHAGVGSDHTDPGPVILETMARLSPDSAPVLWILRFGTRLPITSLISGLDRDQSDFFATLGWRSGRAMWIAAEGGVTLNGRPRPFLGQTDAFLYSAGAGYRASGAGFEGDAWIVGHNDLHEADVRGTEDLSELRIGVRTTGRVWAGAQWIHGFGSYGPDNGARITMGFATRVSRVPLLGWR